MRLTVRNKLLGGFAVVLALLAIAAIVAIVSMGGMNAKARTLATQDLPATEIIGAVSGDSSGYRAMLFKQISQNDRADLEATGKLITSFATKVDRGFVAYKPYITDARERHAGSSTRRRPTGSATSRGPAPSPR